MARPMIDGRYSGVAIAFHWTIALLVIVNLIIGLGHDAVPALRAWMPAHKSIGITVLVLVVLRLVWRLYAGAPRPVPGTPGWQERVASATHWLLYAMMLAIPLSGWLYDSASGLRPFRYFGWLEMPKLVSPNESLSTWSHDAHVAFFWILVALVAVHAAAAFYHHVFQNDATLTRMLPRRRRLP